MKMEREKKKRTVRGVTGIAGGSGNCADDGVLKEVPAAGRRRRRKRSGSCIGAEESLRCE